MFNCYISNYLNKIEIDKYLNPNSNNKLMKLLRYLMNRYINIFSKS